MHKEVRQRSAMGLELASQWRKCSPGKNSLQRRRRVLKVACQVFARRGFDGTHVREVCKLAGVNIALVFYHFRDKLGLYQAVQAEAREQLSRRAKRNVVASREIRPEERLQAIIESLFARLSGGSGWIAHLVAQELADETKTSQGTVSEGFRADLTLLESTIRDAVGPEADADTIRLDALNVLSQCVFYCAARRTLTRISPELDEQALRAERLVRHLTLFSLRGLGAGASFPKARMNLPAAETPTQLFVPS